MLDFSSVDGDQAARHVDELVDIYTEVYADPPYEWGQEHADLFVKRFNWQRQQAGFRLVEARDDGQLVGIGLGLTLSPGAPWWQNLTTPVSEDIKREYPNRTFALIELLVRVPWRRQHVAEGIHDRLLADRPEERATLTALPAAEAAQAAYRKWGWERVSQTHNPLPGSPLFDVLVKRLDQTVQPRSE